MQLKTDLCVSINVTKEKNGAYITRYYINVYIVKDRVQLYNLYKFISRNKREILKKNDLINH